MISFYKYKKYLVNWLKKYYFCKEIAHHAFKAGMLRILRLTYTFRQQRLSKVLSNEVFDPCHLNRLV